MSTVLVVIVVLVTELDPLRVTSVFVTAELLKEPVLVVFVVVCVPPVLTTPPTLTVPVVRVVVVAVFVVPEDEPLFVTSMRVTEELPKDPTFVVLVDVCVFPTVIMSSSLMVPVLCAVVVVAFVLDPVVVLVTDLLPWPVT